MEAIVHQEIIVLLKSKGYLNTQQKFDFIQAICAVRVVESPEELWLYLKQQDIKISIATVYTNLRVMVKEQVMVKVPAKNRSHSYHLIGV